MTIERHSIKELHALTSKRHKYGVSSKSDRTYKSIAYQSRMEMLRAIELDEQHCVWTRQVPFWLGEDAYKVIVDFVVLNSPLTGEFSAGGTIRYEEVKGAVTPRDKRHWKMWEKYGPGPLRVLSLIGGRWKEIERIEPIGWV